MLELQRKKAKNAVIILSRYIQERFCVSPTLRPANLLVPCFYLGGEIKGARENQEKKMPKEKILPTVLIIIDICAAVGYLPTGNWRMVVYWAAAATLTTMVTW